MAEQRERVSRSNRIWKVAIVLVMVVLVVAVFACKQQKDTALISDAATPQESHSVGTEKASQSQSGDPSETSLSAAKVRTTENGADQTQAGFPRLVDLGADKCIPCKMMAPILEGLKKEYSGKLQVEFIDVWKNPRVGRQYGIRLIPTQIFYDTDGKEFYRHQGFMSKANILAVFKKKGINLDKSDEPGIVE